MAGWRSNAPPQEGREEEMRTPCQCSDVCGKEERMGQRWRESDGGERERERKKREGEERKMRIVILLNLVLVTIKVIIVGLQLPLAFSR